MNDELESNIHSIKSCICSKSINDIVYYDVKEDYIDKNTGKALYVDENPLFRISEYKCNKRIDFDCDVSLRTIVLHTMAYKFLNEGGGNIQTQKYNNKDGYKFEIGNIDKDEFVYRSDTMNSYCTTLNEYMRLFGDNRDNPKLLVIRESTKKLNFLPEDGSWENCILNHKEYFEKLLPVEVIEFLAVVHTIGNFIPIPFKENGIEFNRPRGFRNKLIHDYWDLTLLALFNWFREKNNQEVNYSIGLKDIVKTEESVIMCEKWLENFKNESGNYSWDKFVSDNYMQDFISISGDKDSYGIPKELWKGHFKQIGLGDNKPKEKEEFIQFFTNSRVAIIARGERIALKLKGIY